MKKFFALLLCLVLAVSALTGCTPASKAASDAGESTSAESDVIEPKGKIILATTTSTEDSGLLAFILPTFTQETGWEVETIAVGTGQTLQMGRDGEADVLLVHARADEDKFVADGYAEQRYDVMYNDFVIVGPKDGAVAYNEDVNQTFQTIAASGLPFVSRGDDSGTHKKELSIWKSLSIVPEDNAAYVSAGQGMGATLGMASQTGAYTLADRATWLTYADKGDLEIICEKSEGLLNPYGVIPVSGTVNEKINTEGGQAFADWITSDAAQELIGTFGVEEFGQALFVPDAK